MKNNIKKMIACQLTLLMALSVGTNVTFAKKAKTNIKLNKTKASLKTGKTLKLKATVKPSSASNKKVVWTTSNKKVAAVESNGTVHAWKKGTVKITATAKDGSGKKATCTIKTSGKAVDTADQLI